MGFGGKGKKIYGGGGQNNGTDTNQTSDKYYTQNY